MNSFSLGIVILILFSISKYLIRITGLRKTSFFNFYSISSFYFNEFSCREDISFVLVLLFNFLYFIAYSTILWRNLISSVIIFLISEPFLLFFVFNFIITDGSLFLFFLSHMYYNLTFHKNI